MPIAGVAYPPKPTLANPADAAALATRAPSPVQVADLGFDPETQAEFDAALVTIQGAIDLKRSIADSYSKSATDGLIAASSSKPKRVAVADANYTADGTETTIAYTSISATRTVTLPLAANYPAGRPLVIKNETTSPYAINVVRAGSESIDGSIQLTIPSTVLRAGTMLYSDGASKWFIVKDAETLAALAGKLDTTAGAVGLANLATAATPALTIGPGSGATGSSIAAGTSAFNFVVAANTDTATLPSASSHGAGRLLLVTTINSGLAVPTFIGTLNRAGSDTIGQAGATSLAIPPGVGFTLLRSNGSSRWDIIAGAGAPGAVQRVAVADTDKTVGVNENLIVYTSITATRTVTLPAPSTVPAGRPYVVKDESGALSAGGKIINVLSASGNIDGGTNVALTRSYASVAFYSDGASAWFTQTPAPDRRLGSTGTTLGANTQVSVVGITDTSAARTVTLPAASAYPPGRILTVKDESGGAATNPITVARAGTDTIDGGTSVSVASNYGVVRLYSDGVSKWFTA